MSVSETFYLLRGSIIGIFTVLFLIMIVLIIILATNYTYKNKVEELSRYQIISTLNIDASIPQILELFIEECFNDYKVKYLILIDGFINTTKEAEIRKDLSEIVSSRISDKAIEKLSLYYNPANIGAVIADKIYITVMDYVAAHNSTYTDNEG